MFQFFFRVTIFLADPRTELNSEDIWLNYRNLKVDNQSVPFILCLRYIIDLFSPFLLCQIKFYRCRMVLKTDNMPMNLLVTRHKCTGELTGPLPDDETFMGDQNLRRMRHLEIAKSNKLLIKEIITNNCFDADADVTLVSGSDKHFIKVKNYT